LSSTLYLTFTPYHLLLARAMHHHCTADALIFYADEAGILASLPEIAEGIPRAEVVLLEPVESTSIRSARRAVRQNVARLDREIRARRVAGPVRLVVFNGSRPDAQIIGRRFASTVELEGVEDGLDAYIPDSWQKPSWWRRRAHRLLFGAVHPGTVDILHCLPYRRFHFLIPELAREQQNARGIDPEAFAEICGTLRPAVAALVRLEHPIADLIMLRHSERLDDVDGYAGAVMRHCESLRAADPLRPVAIKPHPREPNPTLRDLGAHDNFTVLPPWLPSELLGGLVADDVVVRTTLSTFVISSRCILPDRSVMLTGDVDEQVFERLHRWDPIIDRVPLRF
jgi:hypothetical protein